MGRLPVEARHTPTMRVELREKVRFPPGSNDNSASAKSPSRSARQASRAWLLPPYFASPKNRVPPAKQPRGHTKLPPVHQSGKAFEFVRFSERHSRLSSVHSISVSGTCRLTISVIAVSAANSNPLARRAFLRSWNCPSATSQSSPKPTGTSALSIIPSGQQ